MEPFSLLAMSAVGTVTSAIGSIQQGQAAAANLQAQQNAANYNAEIQRQQADQAARSATAQANQQQVQAREVIGKQRASIAESGGGFGGTNSLLIDQSAANAELDRQNILYGGELNRAGLNEQAKLTTYQGGVAGSQVGSSLMAGYMGAGSSIMKGGHNMYRYGKSGGMF